MSADEPTLEQLRRIEEGDRVRIHYDSVFSERGGERSTLEAIVVENDIYEWTGQDEAVNVTIDLDHQGPDERASFETERTRQYEAMFWEGEFQYSQVNTRNGARWNRLSRVGDDPTIERINGDFELLEEAVDRDDLPQAARDVLERAEQELKAAEFRDLLDDNEEAIEDLGLTENALPDREDDDER